MADSFSRFFKTQQIIFDSETTYGMWSPPSWLLQRPNNSNILKFKVSNKFEGRPDLIANRLYGSPLLDWVIISFNNVLNPMGWPKAGEIIECPSDQIVMPDLI